MVLKLGLIELQGFNESVSEFGRDQDKYIHAMYTVCCSDHNVHST